MERPRSILPRGRRLARCMLELSALPLCDGGGSAERGELRGWPSQREVLWRAPRENQARDPTHSPGSATHVVHLGSCHRGRGPARHIIGWMETGYGRQREELARGLGSTRTA